jgi:hypothetical protein
MALSNRTKLGITLAVGVIASLASFLAAVLILALAAFLIAWGQQPKRTEEIVAGLPFGDRLIKALTQLDVIIGSDER